MRNLKECQAEVFRRSEKKIRQRRNRILTACIPLALCGAVAIAYATANIAPDTAPTDGVTIYVEQSSAVSGIEITGPEGTRVYTDPAQIEKIFEHLAANTTNILKDEVIQESTRGESDNSDMSEEKDYTITVYSSQGEDTVYNFAGNILNNYTENKVYILTEEEAKALEEVLELPE